MSAPREEHLESRVVPEGAPRNDDGSQAEGDGTPEHDDELTIGQERVLELVSYVVVNLVSRPESVTVDIVRRHDRDVYQVKVHQDDLGRVIGKGGQTARALRVLLMAVSARTDQRIALDIVE